MRLGLFLVTIATLIIAGVIVRSHLFYSLRINGPAYQKIAKQSELLDDFDPASQYIDGAFVSMDQMLDLAAAGDTLAVSKRMFSIQEIRIEYLARRQYWLDQGAGDQHLAVLMDRAAKPALALFDRFDQAFLPAIDRRDYSAARRLLNGPMDSLFRVHEDRVADVRERARRLVKQQEADVNRSVQQSTLWLAAGTLVLIVLLFAIAWRKRSRVRLCPPSDHIGSAQRAQVGWMSGSTARFCMWWQLGQKRQSSVFASDMFTWSTSTRRWFA